MPEPRTLFQIKTGDHVLHDEKWRLVTGKGTTPGKVELELSFGLRRTSIVRGNPGQTMEAMQPDEWFQYVVARHREEAARVAPKAWGPVERLARGKTPRPGYPVRTVGTAA
jgi:hypothetical protein